MKYYWKTIRLVLTYTGKDYAFYVLLCITEVIRNIANLLCVYSGVSLVVGKQEQGSMTTMLLLSIVTSVLCELSAILLNMTMNKVEKKIEKSVYQEVLYTGCLSPFPMLYENSYQNSIRDLLEEATPAITSLAVNLCTYMEAVCNIAVFVVVAWKAGPVFLIITLGCIAILEWMAHFFEEKQEERRESLSKIRNLRRYVNDFFYKECNHVEIVANDAREYIVHRTEAVNHEYADRSDRVEQGVTKYKLSFGGVLCMGITVSVALLLMTHRGGLSGSLQVTILVGMVLLYNEMKSLFSNLLWDKEELYYAREYFEFLEKFQRPRESAETMQNELTFQNVSLNYAAKIAVRNVTFHMRFGEMILVIGENGSGKTSLMNLLAGLYAPSAGTVLDGTRNPVSQQTLLAETAYVSQCFPMLPLSVRESFFAQKGSDREIEDALKKVDLWEKILNCGKGLDGIVGEDIAFSKGQWQRFLVARTLVHRERKIWIFDEPTSAMDALHEEKILKIIKEAAEDRMAVVVTHRLGFAKKADRILHMSKGEIVCMGSHEEMMESDEEYRTLYLSQSELYHEKPDSLSFPGEQERLCYRSTDLP